MSSYDKYAAIRDEKGLTDYRVAKETGIGTATFSNWKNGKYTPKTDKIELIAEFLGVSPEEISEPKRKKNIIRVYHAQSASDGGTKAPRDMVQVKSEDMPRPKLQKDISERLRTRVNEAMEEVLSENSGLYYDDPETRELVEFLHKSPEYKVLFDAAKRVPPEDIEFVRQMLDKMAK